VNNMSKRTLQFVLLFIFLPSYASENTQGFSDAHAAYTVAVKKLVDGRKVIANREKITLTEVTEDKDGKKNTHKTTVYIGNDGSEVQDIELAETEPSGSLGWQSNILVDPARFPLSANFISETELTWTFEIPMQVKANIEGNENEVDGESVNREIQEALTAELTISKRDPRILSQKIYAKSSFSPESLVRISKFLIRVEYGQAWQDGPWVTTSLSKTLEGKYALFVSVKEFSVTSYENYQLMKQDL